jgi:hypothetical protein
MKTIVALSLFGGTYSVDLSRVTQSVSSPNRMSGATLKVFYENSEKPEYNINYSDAKQCSRDCKALIDTWDEYKEELHKTNADFISIETEKLTAEIDRMTLLMAEFKSTLGVSA